MVPSGEREDVLVAGHFARALRVMVLASIALVLYVTAVTLYDND
jgi:hypothetical protein